MFRFLLFASFLFLIFSLLIATTRIVSEHNVAFAALTDYQCTPQPCWHHIYPSRTSFREAGDLIRGDGNLSIISSFENSNLCWNTVSGPLFSGCITADSEGVVNEILLSPPPNSINYGDAILLFGDPTFTRMCLAANQYPGTDMDADPELYFFGNIEISNNDPIQPHVDQFSPSMFAGYIIFSNQPPVNVPVWRGFTNQMKVEMC